MSVYESPQIAFRAAIAAVGGQVNFAKLIGRTQGAISKMLSEERLLAAEHVRKVEAATGVPKEDLRPDIYPRDVAPASQASIASEGAGGEQSTTARADSVPDSLSGLSA